MAKSPMTPEQRLERDTQKLASLQASISKQKSIIAERNRKLDTRRKILMGAFLIEWFQTKPEDALSTALRAKLPEFRKYLTERNDGLFDDLFAPPATAAAE
jgi:hypothetical protein